MDRSWGGGVFVNSDGGTLSIDRRTHTVAPHARAELDANGWFRESAGIKEEPKRDVSAG